MVITLIGYRGCGKSSVAAPLAERLGWDWCDADTVLEERAGKTIREIFADDGEPAFRALERDVMADLLAREKLVIAAGGGAILDPGTRERIRKAGFVVWLQAPVEVLASRIQQDTTTEARRPQLTNKGTTSEIADVLAQREPFYLECANLAVDSGTVSVEEIVSQILTALGRG